jgi:AcrR family transcriptional regulator
LKKGSIVARKAVGARREDLIEAAIRVLVRDGLAGATTRAIVAEAGASLSAFHYCFDSREDLLIRAAERLADRTVTDVRAAFAAGADLRSAIASSLAAFWRRVEDDPDRELVGYELAQYSMRHDGLRPLAERLIRHYLDAHEAFLREAADAAGIEWRLPLPVLARLIHSTLDGLSMCWLIDRDSAHSRAVLDTLTDFLVSEAVSRTDT